MAVTFRSQRIQSLPESSTSQALEVLITPSQDSTPITTITTEQIDTLFQIKAAIHSQQAQLLPLQVRYEQLVTEIRSALSSLPDEQYYYSDQHVLRVGSIPQERHIHDMRETFLLLQSLDPELPFKLMQFRLADIDKYLTDYEQQQIIHKTPNPAKRSLIIK